MAQPAAASSGDLQRHQLIDLSAALCAPLEGLNWIGAVRVVAPSKTRAPVRDPGARERQEGALGGWGYRPPGASRG